MSPPPAQYSERIVSMRWGAMMRPSRFGKTLISPSGSTAPVDSYIFRNRCTAIGSTDTMRHEAFPRYARWMAGSDSSKNTPSLAAPARQKATPSRTIGPSIMQTWANTICEPTHPPPRDRPSTPPCAMNRSTSRPGRDSSDRTSSSLLCTTIFSGVDFQLSSVPQLPDAETKWSNEQCFDETATGYRSADSLFEHSIQTRHEVE